MLFKYRSNLINDDYQSGGFLALDHSGQASLIRKGDFDSKQDLSSNRLVVQSKPILVSYDQEKGRAVNDGGLRDSRLLERAALVTFTDESVSLVMTPTKISLDAFADTILTLSGVQYALNIDGGPSVQMAARTLSRIETVIGWENGEPPSQMPSLFVVTN